MQNPKSLRHSAFWRSFIKKRRKAKKRPSTSLVVKKATKKHLTEPDRWKPPFAMAKDAPPLKVSNRDLTVLDKPAGFEVGDVTATIGIMLQIRMDSAFRFFVNESLERFKTLDWGGISENEKLLNRQKVMAHAGTVYGVYTEPGSGVQIWIVTDLDQELTRICLSDER